VVGLHHAVAFVVLAVAAVTVAWGAVTYRRGRTAGPALTQLLALSQTVVVAQVALGLLLLSGHHRAADHLHYLYGFLSLGAVLAPWLYAPADPRRRLVWFVGATLVGGALAVRAYLTAT
jgi:hypothetical protein